MTKARSPFDNPFTDRDPLEVARELFVYAPIGLATRLTKEFPDLVAEGKSKYSVAKVVGTFAAQQGRRQFEERLRSFLGDEPSENSTQHASAPTKSGEATVSDGAHLAIQHYDTLPAAQVLSHLAGLTVAQRADIAAYERTTRNRRTILNRIDHLNSAQS